MCVGGYICVYVHVMKTSRRIHIPSIEFVVIFHFIVCTHYPSYSYLHTLFIHPLLSPHLYVGVP